MIKLGIVMDPISTIKIKKDSSFSMLLEAQRRGYEIHYMEIDDLYLLQGEAYGHTKKIIKIKQDTRQWYEFDTEQDIFLKNLDVILMRKDPPFNTEYIYATYILERAEQAGSLIINKPKSLRDCNEKLFISWFAKLTPDTLVTRNNKKIREFHQKYGDIILKPLDEMGGKSIFRLTKEEPNLSVIIEILTQYGNRFCMAQNYLSAIKEGDKRVLIINGEPVPYCLARIPAQGETRGNLATGGYGEVRPLTKNDWKIAKTVAPILKEKGLIFVGLDIIGDRLIEINVTSPTCIREIELSLSNISITGILFDVIEKQLNKNSKLKTSELIVH
ncbi:MAG: glutathione synthase [Arsenophonus sp.]